MTILPFSKTIFIVGAEDAFAHSVKCLLESHHRLVRVFARCEEFWAENIHKERDIVLLNLETRQTSAFEMLGRLLRLSRRPHIVLASTSGSVFKNSDQFLGGGVTLKFHPMSPNDLVDTISRL